MSLDDRTAKRIPRYTGRDADGIVGSELQHFGNCPHCGGLIDMRDLGQVIAHVHDRWDEIIDEGPPRKACAMTGARSISTEEANLQSVCS